MNEKPMDRVPVTTDVAGAAAYVGMSERQIRELVYLRRVPFTKIGRLLRFRYSDLDAWLEANTTHPQVDGES